MSDQGNEHQRYTYTSPFAKPPEGSAPEPASSQAQRAGRGRLVLIGAAAALIVLGAALGGAAVGHELWSSSHAAVGVPSGSLPVGGSFGGAGGSSGLGGSGSFGASGNGSVGQVPAGSTGGSVANGAGAASTSAIEAKVSPALVDINSSLTYQGAAGAGTGIVLSSDGEVLTNNHVIDGATNITATDLGNGKTYHAAVVGYDPSQDIAVLQLQGASGLATAELGDSSSLQVGDAVTGIGNAGGTGGTPTSAPGSITALNQAITAGDGSAENSEQLTRMIQTDANIQPGDSGGPLVDSNGRVIGMDTAGSAGSDFGFQRPGGVQAFAIPINEAAAVAKQIVAGQGSATVHIGDSAFLGISISPRGGSFGQRHFGGTSGSTNLAGVPVGSVVNGEPAEKAGLTAGAVITSLDGQSVGSASQLGSVMLAHHPGDSIQLGWIDTAGTSHSSSIELASGPPS